MNKHFTCENITRKRCSSFTIHNVSKSSYLKTSLDSSELCGVQTQEKYSGDKLNGGSKFHYIFFSKHVEAIFDKRKSQHILYKSKLKKKGKPKYAPSEIA